MSSCFCVLLLVTVKNDFEFSWLFGIFLQSVSVDTENAQQNKKNNLFSSTDFAFILETRSVLTA